ncbi:MAG: GIDE domain-containing protein [Candidatus Omnitrophica bacterium]|nr:GIDE domain-containing protein [Candidatus Omnitrophota bacterium]
MSKSEDKLLFYSFIGAGFGIWSFIKGWKSWRLKRVIQEIPTSKVRSLALGLAEVTGTIMPLQVTQSPILKKTCVFHHCKVEEYHSSGKSGHWVTIEDLKTFFPFYVQDETGKVLIENSDADVRVQIDLKYQTRAFSSCPEHIAAFCSERGIARSGFLGGKPLRFTEYVLEPDDYVYILGTAKDNPQVKEFVNNQDNIIMGRSDDTPYYVISDYSEKELLEQLSWKCYLSIFGGPILFLACCGYIMWHFGIK